MLAKFTSILTIAAGATIAQSASAADLPPMPTKAPAAVVVVQNWSGCYIGGHAGGGWARDKWTNTAKEALFGDLNPGDNFSQTASGFVGGGQIGCNYQTGALVFGVEGTFTGSTIKRDLTNTVFGNGLDDVFTHKVRAIGTATGRLGYAAGPWMPYVKGGYAAADVSFSVSDTVGANVGAASASKWHHGWVVGGGLEYMITRNWIVGAEYNYISLQTKSYEFGDSSGVYTFDFRPRIHTAVGRISYKW